MFKYLAILFAFCAVATAADSDVVVGTAGNFKEITKEGLVLVEFYAPWCGHCKKLAPEWEKAATTLKGQAVLVKVDATVESDLAQQFGIRGYPTIKTFVDGEASDYEGGRTSDAIVAYAKKRLSPPVEELHTADAVKEFKAKYPTAAVIHVKTKDVDAFKSFESHAKVLRDSHNFGVIYDAALYDGASENGVVLHKQFDDLKAHFTGDLSDKKAFMDWLKLESFKLVDEIGPENYRGYVERGLPLAWLFVDPSKTDDTKAAKDVLNSIAPAYKGKFSAVWLEGPKYAQMVQKFGHSGKKFPVFAIDTMDNKYFAYPEDKDISKAALSEWLEKWSQGTLERTIKSEAVPEQSTVDGLTTVVGKTFDELVAKSDKDVLIEFYAPWCGHCKKLAPIYKKLAAGLKDVSSVTIAQMDATANDPSGDFDIQGFPTLYFVPKGKKPVAYEGERTAVEMLRFIKKHAATSFDLDEKAVSDEL